MTHACYDCRRNGLGFPCHIGGRPNPRLVAKANLDRIKLDGHIEHEPWWQFECFHEANTSDPELCWRIICEAVPLLGTPQQAATFAAGLPEDFAKDHLPAFIDRIEALARESPRFRFVLSGIWPPLDARDDFPRQRFERARAPGPWIDHGDPLPPA